MKNKKVTIIGLGLIGGSLARCLHERLGIHDIIGVNRSVEPINQALKDGTITRGFTTLDESIYSSDIIFICTPVKRTLEYIDIIAKKVKPDCIITDVGSTKAEIIEYVNSMQEPPLFIGGHPMAGTEKTGYSASFSHLFENAYYILSPSRTTTEEAMTCMIEIVEGIGGIPVIIEGREHDKVTGSISHVPHIVASALVNMVKALDTPDEKMQKLAAGGFKDITRIASSSPEMWENIVLSNKHQIKGILKYYVELLNKFIDNMDADNSDSIYKFFDDARNYRNSFAASKRGLIPLVYEIVIDIIDKPGMIGEIATILGSNGVNIKNITVSNSREFEQGCLKITLSTVESVNISYDLLTTSGYKVYKMI